MAKPKKKKSGKKSGKRSSKKKAKKSGKRGGKKRPKRSAKRSKLTKRQRAARKAARTRAEKKEARRRAARKAAKSRKKGKRSKKRSSGRKGKKRKSSGRKGKKRKSARRKPRSEKQIERAASREYSKYIAHINRLQREKAQAEKRMEAAKRRKDAGKTKALIRLQKQRERLQREIERVQQAAEEARRRRRRGGKHGRKRNPIHGAGETVGALLGIGIGGLTFVAGDRFFATHKIAPVAAGQGGAGGFIDQPAQGDVPNVVAAALPIWGNFKTHGWKRIGWAIANVAVPLGGASAVKQHEGAKAFLQLWGYTALALTVTKLAVDGARALSAKTGVGMRLFAAESVAKSVQTVSKGQQLPAISVDQGLGLPGLTGYGKPTGTGCACGGKCSKCASVQSPNNGGQTVTQGPTPTPQPAPQPNPVPRTMGNAGAEHADHSVGTGPRSISAPKPRTGHGSSNVRPLRRWG